MVQSRPVPAQAMQERKLRRSIPSWLGWSGLAVGSAVGGARLVSGEFFIGAESPAEFDLRGCKPAGRDFIPRIFVAAGINLHGGSFDRWREKKPASREGRREILCEAMTVLGWRRKSDGDGERAEARANAAASVQDVARATAASASFEELALPLLASLYNLARWLTRDAVEAEDLVQETLVKALRGFAGFEAGTNFKAWIFRILRNTFLTSRSGLAAGRTGSLEEEMEAGAAPEAAIDRETPEMNLMRLSDRAALDAGGAGGVDAAAAGGSAAVRCGGDEVQGDCDGAGGADRDGDVARGAGAENQLARDAGAGHARPEGGAELTEHLSMEELNALADGELSAAQLARVNEHLTACPQCTASALGRKPAEVCDGAGGTTVCATGESAGPVDAAGVTRSRAFFTDSLGRGFLRLGCGGGGVAGVGGTVLCAVWCAALGVCGTGDGGLRSAYCDACGERSA